MHEDERPLNSHLARYTSRNLAFTDRVIHMQRPEPQSVYTFCGWHQSDIAFVNEHSNGNAITSHKSLPYMQRIDPAELTCMRCHEVHDDLCSWRELNKGNFLACHLKLSSKLDFGTLPAGYVIACGIGSENARVAYTSPEHWHQADETCLTCDAIYQRLFHTRRPEIIETPRETWEQYQESMK